MKKYEEIFSKYGIKNSEKIDLQKFNIIIGQNGAGKTRLLRAFRDCFIKENMTVIYVYFPDFSVDFKSNNIPDSEFQIPLYDIVFENGDIQLSDYIRYMKEHGYDFLNDLLNDITRMGIRKKRAQKVQQEFNELLKVLINRELIFDKEIMLKSFLSNTILSLNEEFKRMSPGESMLFYLCYLLSILEYTQRDHKKLVLLLDEPEMHLHPKALIKFINYLKKEEIIDICCIATHSIFLVPIYEFREIIHIDRGEVQPYNSSLYENIFENVIGKDQSLSDFLISRDMWKYYEFIAECFSLPTIVRKVNTKDEQFLKFVNHMELLGKQEKKITVLDYGAGAGRLGKTIYNSEDNIKNKIEYFYYDKYDKKPVDLKCESFENIDEIKRNNKKFQCVVLMNVLHEIEVTDWENTFLEIYDILEDDGYLLIFEVIILSHGEQPYGNNGFILLGENQIKRLFSSNIKSTNLKAADKTNMFVIPKSMINNISKKSVLAALESLREELYNDLKSKYIVRRERAQQKIKTSQNMIKNYGFLSQHYLNSIFAIELFNNALNK